VKVGEVTKRRKRTYRRKSSGGGSGGGQVSALNLPNVIYQSSSITPVPFNPEPLPKITEPAPKPRTIMEDVGVGTEGFVNILEKPTKKETLSELTTPIAEKVPPAFQNASPAKITDKIDKSPVELKGRDGGVPTFNFAEYQQMEKPIKQPMDLPPLDTGIYTPYDKPSKESEKTTILSSMYERYGPAIEESAKKREDARIRRNQQARERYAKKKEQQKPK
jgi:hypothetical protein